MNSDLVFCTREEWARLNLAVKERDEARLVLWRACAYVPRASPIYDYIKAHAPSPAGLAKAAEPFTVCDECWKGGEAVALRCTHTVDPKYAPAATRRTCDYCGQPLNGGLCQRSHP